MNKNKMGTPDNGFGKNGEVSVPFSGVPGLPGATLALPNKQLLVAVSRWGILEQARIVRLNEDGTADLTFGPHGAIEIPFEWGVWFYPNGLSRLTNGGWLITGSSVDDRHLGVRLTIVRQDENGQMDSSFGDGGRVIIDVKKLVEVHYDLQVKLNGRPHDEETGGKALPRVGHIDVSAFEQEGKIVATTSVAYGTYEVQGVVLRLNADGTLDNTFNGTGFLLVDLPSITYKQNWAYGSAIQKTGKILVCGMFRRSAGEPFEAFVMRYNQNGSVDTLYNEGRGIVVISRDRQRHELTNMTLRTDDGVVATGVGNGEGLIVVLTPEGVFNQVFNSGQPLYSRIDATGAAWRRCDLQRSPDKLVVSGQADRGTLVIARFLADGKPDNDFGDNGWVVVEPGKGASTYSGGALMDDNRIVVCSEIMVGGGEGESIGAVIRYVG
ncbi:delta-60 repeat domain-containing protein [Pseudomonas sp. PMCC200344]|uniref:delta-60 repeat domain-containing protein n=1 Tax=Pseudomonas sp. PMCC200344 TaxID=3042028 RepID=UPI0024B332CE|nr:delta-60 repeat domain-containing protein [Pseudomonas sp. PMCC200344]